ncbi:unnamed protein product [Rotaria sp. Silwood2]|nr:unnamed protein product [Rotaria sp. Silwood2]CAF2826154.1 unnamed protein product [Rotaria sp. Silwood2]CAF3011223.1 unnamed protein product [Rotaria sp. Silwood2]CAF3359843.1 unnamed protein product [Rotaria sp. Silwood2]CAF4106295.1 unnamed protein product [Rotaria sp. Silwood2]
MAKLTRLFYVATAILLMIVVLETASTPIELHNPEPRISLSQCMTACRAGVTAMEAFCRLIPHPAIRAGCWAISLYAGTPSVAMCTGFCYNYFGSKINHSSDV